MHRLKTCSSAKKGTRSGRVCLPYWALFCATGLLLVGIGCDSRPQANTGDASSASVTNNPAIQGELIQPLPSSETPTSLTPASDKSAATVAAQAPFPPAQPLRSSDANVSNSLAIAVSTPSNASASTTPPTSDTALVTTNSPSSEVGTNSALSLTSDGFALVGFDKLSAFNFDVSDEILQADSTNSVEVAKKTADQIPKVVREYDQKRIALKGFMLPLKVEGGKVTELLIMRDQSMCCYGAVPKINEWVSVKMVGGGVKPMMDQAITLYGKLFVGEMRENGYLVGIYRMDGERVEGPLEP